MLLSAKLVKPDGSTLFRRYRRKNKLVAVICLLAISLLLSTPTGIAQDDPPDDPPQDPDWLPVAEGIDFRLFTLPDPNNVFVARMDRSNLNLTIESSIAQGRLSGGAETVSSMAQRYDQAINFWPASEDTNFETHQLPISFSGNRNNVVVAINGDYTYKDENNNPVWGIPARGQIHSSWYAKRFTNLESGSGFVWKRDRSVFIGECILHPYPPNFGRKQIVTFLKSGSDQLFNGINIPRGTDDLIIYTPQYDKNTLTDGSGIEVLVEMSESFLIRPEPSMVIGVIRAIYDGVGSTTIPFDHVVLSASGAARDELLNNQIEVGDQIGLSQEIRHLKEEDCDTPIYDYDWTHAYASVGGSFYFLKDGAARGFNDKVGAIVRNPRTAIAYNDEYIFFIVVDGRDIARSLGMTILELANFSLNNLGATHGIALDGGGSSTMVINGSVINNTLCNNYCPHLFFPIVNNRITYGQESIKATKDIVGASNTLSHSFIIENGEITNNPWGTVERWIPNGLMMVVVEPMEKIERFVPGDEIVTTLSANLRLGPGINYGYITTIPGGVTGTIVEHANKLNGVYAKGFYWWKVKFIIDGEERIGWMADFLLADPNELESQLIKLFESSLR